MIDAPPYDAELTDKSSRGVIGFSWKRWINSIFFILSRVQLYCLEYRSSPGATGFTVTIPKDVGVLLLTPAAAYANGTIVMPADPTNRQRIEMVSSQAVAAIVLSSAATILNAPAALVAGVGLAFIYMADTNTWHRLY